MQSYSIQGISKSGGLCLDVDLVWQFLADLERYYPDFEAWFYKKVLPDLVSGKREIIIKKADDQISAIAILKKYADENKICTFRVAENFKGKGLGTELMRESLEWLGCTKPLITVNEENADEFEGFLKKFDFKESLTLTGEYRYGKKEVFYNAPLKFFN